MEDFRSKSVGHAKMQHQQQLDNGGYYGGGGGMQDLRCYSASYATAPAPAAAAAAGNNDAKLKKGRSASGGGSVSKSWSFSDPESQRKRRVASYKVYAMEGKVKGSLRKSFRWLKERCSRVVYGW